MSRPSYLGALSALLASALLAGPLAAQITIERKPLPDSSVPPARVQRVSVRGSDQTLEVEIQISGGTVAPATQSLTGPDRIVVDFPGAIPAPDLRSVTVNRGALKGIRPGLFFSNPPITRVVLDLGQPQSYQIASDKNAIVVKLGPVKLSPVKPGPAGAGANPASAVHASAMHAAGVRLRDASSIATSTAPSTATSSAPLVRPVSAGVASATPASAAPVSAAGAPGVPTSEISGVNPETVAPAAPVPPPPAVSVTYQNGMLRIHSERATLAQVLFEVHMRTQAEIAIPAGAEQEQVIADLGPAPAREVLADLLNGSSYNFIFVGQELSLERVILTRRNPTSF